MVSPLASVRGKSIDAEAVRAATERAARAPAEAASRWLRGSVALVWLASGVLVLHPFYREVTASYLEPLGVGPWFSWAAGGAAVLVAVRVARGPSSTWLVVGQISAVAALSLALAISEPMLLVHPMGVLTKNLPLVAALGTAWLLEREGWSRRATWLLRAGMAVIWITEGIFPKILFQQEMELAIARQSPFVFIDPSLFLTLLGAAQALSGVLALALRGRPLQALLVAQGVALIALPILASWNDAQPWVDPLGPLTKTAPIAVGTFVLAMHLRDEPRASA